MELKTGRKDTFMSVRNPLFKLLAVLVLTIPVIFTLDPKVPAILIVCYVLLFPWWGVSSKKLARLLIPVIVGAFLSGFSTLILGQASGNTLIKFLWMHITDGSVKLSYTVALRVLAIALPAVVLFATTEATELGDALIQKAKLPERFVLGAVAALRMVSLMQHDWQMLQRARRARGLVDGSKVKAFISQAYALFVISLRRANKLAVSMQVKGFGAVKKRSWARKSIVSSADWVFLGTSFVLVLIAFLV